MIILVVGSYIWHASSALARTWTCIPWTITVLTRVRCLSQNQTWIGKYSAIPLLNKHQGAVMRIRFERSFEARLMTIETILNSHMSVAYITDCATSPVTAPPVLSMCHQSCHCATSPVNVPPVLSQRHQSCHCATSPVTAPPVLSLRHQSCHCATSPVTSAPPSF